MMKLLSTLLGCALPLLLASADDVGEIRYFLVTVGEIHEGKGFECRFVVDTNWPPPGRIVNGDHVVRMDTTKYELYNGQRVAVVVVADGVVKSEDGSRTARAWKLVPGRPVKLYD